MKSRLLASLFAAAAVLVASSASAAEPAEKPASPGSKITFKKIQLDDKFRSEGVAIGNFAGPHGKVKDIAAGSVYYTGPDWKRMVTIADKPGEYDPHHYSDSFCNFADDVNGDGFDDLIIVGFPGKETWWWENPGTPGGKWKQHLLTAVTNNESPSMWPMFNDKQRSLLCGTSPDPKAGDGPERRMAYISRDPSDAYKPWVVHAISAKAAPGTVRFSHGLGWGDVNGDGRPDILVNNGWWEAPADPKQEEWTFHKADFRLDPDAPKPEAPKADPKAPGGKAPAPKVPDSDCSQMYVYDVNGDGRPDVISCAAHRIGISWHEQMADGTFKTHVIDKSFSQSHGVCFADITGTGVPSIITGKRWWAHGPTGDVDADKPAVLCWFELVRKPGSSTTSSSPAQVEWVKHQIDDDSGVGTQFEVGDINGDGLLDIAVANKKGVFIFLQERTKE